MKRFLKTLLLLLAVLNLSLITASPARAHGGTSGDLWHHWAWQDLAWLLLIGGVYSLGLLSVWPRAGSGSGITRGREAACGAGMIVLFLAIALPAVAQKTEGNKVFYESGELHYEYGLEKGIPNGITKEYYREGKVRFEWNYANGYLQGVTKEYYPDGTLKAEWAYADGELDGVSTLYYKSGKKQYEMSYDGGSKQGATREYHENGELKNEWPFVAGKIDGVVKSFTSTGDEIATWTYRNGVLL